MADGIKSKFPGIGDKTVGSGGTSTEWNGIIDELELINNSNNIDIGDGTVTNNGSQEYSVVIGKEATEEAASGASAFGNGGRTLVGSKAKCGDWKGTAIGWNARADGLSSTALGHAACVEGGGTHGTAIGRGSWVPPNAPDVGGGGITSLGSTSNQDVYFANSMGADFDGAASNGSANGTVTTPSSDGEDILLHGRDAKDYKPVPTTTNLAGGNIALCAGRAVGNEIGGKVKIKTAPVIGVGSPNVKNNLVDAAVFDSEKTGVDTRFLLLDVVSGTLKRVSFGADDSAGAGFKVLRVEN